MLTSFLIHSILSLSQDFVVIEKNEDYSVWGHGLNDSSLDTATLKSKLTPIRNHNLLRDHLPKPFAILIDAELKSSMGFHSQHLKAPDETPAILIRPEALISDRSLRTLVHELIHLAHAQERPDEEPWLREGLALVGEQIILGSMNSVYQKGLLEPESSLIGDLTTNLALDRSENQKNQYGHLALFFSYAFKHCGKEKLVDDLLYRESKLFGVDHFEGILREKIDKKAPGFCKDFSSLFQAFQKARFLQSPSSTDSYVVITSLQTTIRDSRRALEPYSASAYKRDSGADCSAGDAEIRDRVCLQIRER